MSNTNPTTTTAASPETTQGRFKRSWIMFKSAWRAFKQDKELTALPFLNGLIALAVTVPVVAWAVYNHHLFLNVVSQTADGSEAQFKPAAYILGIALGLAITAITSIFSGALIHGALERFRGNDPSVRSSIRAALKRGGSLLGFGIFSGVIGYLLSYIAERIPFLGGKIIAWLASSAWNVASFFAVPVIVTSDTAINPIDATKRSIEIIKKTWGESLIISAGTAIFAVIGMTVYGMLFGLLLGYGAGVNANDWVLGAGFAIGLLGLVAMILIFTTIEAFAKAAIFHFATTGEAPEQFDARLMRSAFTPKKARKVFSA